MMPGNLCFARCQFLRREFSRRKMRLFQNRSFDERFYFMVGVHRTPPAYVWRNEYVKMAFYIRIGNRGTSR